MLTYQGSHRRHIDTDTLLYIPSSIRYVEYIESRRSENLKESTSYDYADFDSNFVTYNIAILYFSKLCILVLSRLREATQIHRLEGITDFPKTDFTTTKPLKSMSVQQTMKKRAHHAVQHKRRPGVLPSFPASLILLFREFDDAVILPELVITKEVNHLHRLHQDNQHDDDLCLFCY